MAGLNNCNFIGHLGRDPELKYSNSGTAICNASIAVTEKYKDKENTEWVNLVFWDKLAEVSAQYLSKGGQVYVSGKMQTQSWEKDGQKHSKVVINVRELVMLGGKGKQDSPQNSPQEQPQQPAESGSSDLPF